MAAPKNAARPPRGAAAHVPLTRAVIVEAALAEIDAHGLEALSMRKLGAVLGVEAMALYHHFPGKGALLDAVMERLLDEADLPPRGTAPPLARLRTFMESYRRIAINHPHGFILLVYRRFNTERTFQFYERILEALEELGFDAAASARYFRLMGYYVGGAGMADIASRARMPDATAVRLESFAGSKAYPRVAKVVPHLRVANLDAIFDFGLEVILSAIGKAARRNAVSARGSSRGSPSSARSSGG
jgi:AcrR family transcriptional regulator